MKQYLHFLLMVCIVERRKVEIILPLKSTVTKFNGPGIAYEIGIAIYEDCVLWIKRPFVPSTHDKTMFESEDGPPDMPEGKRGIGDTAYQSLKEWTTVHRNGHSKEMTNFINRVRARHESFYNRLKTFGILSNFRGS